MAIRKPKAKKPATGTLAEHVTGMLVAGAEKLRANLPGTKVTWAEHGTVVFERDAERYALVFYEEHSSAAEPASN